MPTLDIPASLRCLMIEEWQVSGLQNVEAAVMFLLSSNSAKWVPPMATGEVITVLGALIFAISVFRELLRRRT